MRCLTITGMKYDDIQKQTAAKYIWSNFFFIKIQKTELVTAEEEEVKYPLKGRDQTLKGIVVFAMMADFLFLVDILIVLSRTLYINYRFHPTCVGYIKSPPYNWFCPYHFCSLCNKTEKIGISVLLQLYYLV